MRQLLAYVPRGQGARALECARRAGGANLACLQATEGERELDLVVVHARNDQIEALVAGLQQFEGLELTLVPRGVLTLGPPQDEAPDQVADVSFRSPLEVFLGGLQSVGSWRGFLGYAGCSAVVAWMGLHTNTTYLLTAAMLIAPFAGPAMTLALGTARGDGALVGRALGRYVASLALSIGVAFVLTHLLGQDRPTESAVAQSLLSAYSVLLPLTAGAAGALNLCQSERDSLVTAAGPGMLVAASLAPPAAMIGIALALAEWAMAASGVFVLALQLVGINVAGAAVFALLGLGPRGVRFERGRPWVRRASLALSAVGVAGLLWVQHSSAPELQQASVAQRLAELASRAAEETGPVKVVTEDVRFTRTRVEGREAVLIRLYAHPVGVAAADEVALAAAVRERVLAAGFAVTPLVEVKVLPGAAPREPGR